LSRTVDKDAGMTFGAAHGFNDARGKRLQFGERKIFFADLNGVDAAASPFPGERNQASALRGFVAAEQASVGDGVKKHLR
ncbi:MAG: hypothetical protein WBH45_16560, partial [Acidobacteriaceae bacterium]